MIADDISLAGAFLAEDLRMLLNKMRGIFLIGDAVIFGSILKFANVSKVAEEGLVPFFILVNSPLQGLFLETGLKVIQGLVALLLQLHKPI